MTRGAACIGADLAVKSTRGDVFDARTFLAARSVAGTLVAYRPAAVIFSQGDRGDDVFYLRRGRVRLSVVSTAGRHAVVALPRAGDFFGEACLRGSPSASRQRPQ